MSTPQKPTSSGPDARRTRDLAMIHIAARRLFGDVSPGGAGREDWQDWLEVRTGKRSSGHLSAPERSALIKVLRRDGLIPDRARNGAGRGGPGHTVAGAARPTRAQWNRIGGLARSMGWERGLEDPRLRGFVTRTAKVSDARFLSRAQATSVILGLEAWLRQRSCDREGDQEGGSDEMS